MRAITLVLACIAMTSCTPAKLAHKPTGPEIKCQVYGGPACYPPLHPDPADLECRAHRAHKPKVIA